MCLPWLLRVTENKGSTPEREPEKRLPHPRKAAGAQITHSRHEEVVTKNNETVLFEAGYRNGYNLNPLTRIYERASLVPAAAVIPALKVYIVIAAVKKLVVGSALGNSVHLLGENWASRLHFAGFPCIAFTGRVGWLASLL
jgi:hypothetical protein